MLAKVVNVGKQGKDDNVGKQCNVGKDNKQYVKAVSMVKTVM